MTINKKAFFIIIIFCCLIGYVSFYFFQKVVEEKIREQLFSIKSFQYTTFTVKSISKQLELNSKARVTKNNYSLTFCETEQIFSTYNVPSTNPEELNFNLYFTQKLTVGTKVHVCTIIPILEEQIKTNSILGSLLKNSNEKVIIDIFLKTEKPNTKYYKREEAIKYFTTINSASKTIWMALCLLIGVLIYFKKFAS